MNIAQEYTHLIVDLSAPDDQTAPRRVIQSITGADKAVAKAEGWRFWGYDPVVIALDDPNADACWRGDHATPRAFFATEYDIIGVPRAWLRERGLSND